jgi:predicted alpha-1,2-mannosidase
MGKIIRKTSHSLQGSTFPVALQYDRDDSGEEPVKDGLILRWAPSAGGPTVIVLRISVAGAGAESAQKNIDKETGGLGFDGVKERTRAAWQKELSVISLGDGRVGKEDLAGNNAKREIFYTALYHSLLMPWIISDVEGKYRGRDGQVHKASGKNEYGQFSPWDTFRSLHPLLCLLFPDRQRDMVLSMLDIYRQTGYLPTESMTGNHTIPILVDSWMKGIRGFDSLLAYAAMKKSLVEGPFLQSDMEAYHEKGYIPFTYPESVTRTVEYAYDDWALGQFASPIQREKDATDGYQASLLNRSYAYRNLFNPDELFLLPRDGNQFKLRPGTTGYKEGDKWVYSYFVPQHPKDLVNLMGGDAAFTARLDSALADQSIVFDNETVFHIPYLFNYSGRPDRTQYWIRAIMDKRWSATPGGLPGNDDLGSLSSWYVLSALGIYPVCPGRPFYDIGVPLFREARLRLPGGKQFVIKTRNGGGGVLVNNKKFEGLLLPHEWVMQGGEMVFEMTQEPAKIASVTVRDPEREPEFRLSNFSLSTKEVSPNELFWVRFSLSN